MRVTFWCVLGLFCFLKPVPAQSDPPPRFDLNDGDRIVLLGDTLIEGDQRYGYLETWLTISNPDKNLTFRNLGWSGDTVGGVSRSGFDPPEAGFEQLRQQILAVKPTVVVVGYGMADSFAGEAGLPAFDHHHLAFGPRIRQACRLPNISMAMASSRLLSLYRDRPAPAHLHLDRLRGDPPAVLSSSCRRTEHRRILVMFVSMAVDYWRSRALGRIAAEYDSQALEADALHFSTDIWSSAVVVLGLALVWSDEATGLSGLPKLIP